jgi:hypothetical protein
VNRALDVLQSMLADRNFLTRAEIGRAGQGRQDFPEAGSRLGHLIMLAELRGVVCSGPTKGVHHSYALVDEVVPPTPQLDADEALARLVHRFFAGHGPASAADFARWSSLTMGDCRRGVEMLGDRLECIEVDGVLLWFDPARQARRVPSAPAAWLFPTYDEVVLTYPSLAFAMVDGHPRSASDDPFWARVVCGTRNVGLWKRSLTREAVIVTLRLAPGLSAEDRKAVDEAAHRLARFLDRPLIRTDDGDEPELQ